MLFTLTLFAGFITSLYSFTGSRFKAAAVARSHSRLNAATSLPIEITGRDFEVTGPIKERVESKVRKVLSKLGHDVNGCHVRLRVHRFPNEEHHTQTTKPDSQISEVTVSMKGGAFIKATERTEDMYSSIDLMAHRLSQKLNKHNQKILDKVKVVPSGGQALVDYTESNSPSIFDEEELLLQLDEKYRDQAKTPDPFSVDMSVVKPKSFAMPPISVEEAVLCLYYIDHPFYVFRNKDTQEINVVYKRESGGVGHIMPE